MNNEPDETEPPEPSWLSVFLVICGLGAVLAAGFSILNGGLPSGLFELGGAVLFFALRRVVEQQRNVDDRLRRIERLLKERREGSA